MALAPTPRGYSHRGITFFLLDACLRRRAFFSQVEMHSFINNILILNHSILWSPGPYSVVRSYLSHAVGILSLWENSIRTEPYPVCDLQGSTQRWEDVSVLKCIFHSVTNAWQSLYSAKQEGRDAISNQPCVAAYLSFVTIFNTVYQRKTHSQTPILSY